MSIWISKGINCKRYKQTIIDGFAAIKTAFGDNFDKRNFFIMEAYESCLSSMTEDEDGESGVRLRVSPYTLKGAGTNYITTERPYRFNRRYAAKVELSHPAYL